MSSAESKGYDVKICIVAFISLFCLVGGAQTTAPELDRVAVRNQLLQLLETHPSPELIVDPPAIAGSAQARLLAHVWQTLKPKDEARAELGLKSEVYSQIVDAGLYDSEAEQKTYLDLAQDAGQRLAAYAADEAYSADIVRAGELAEGLPGDFAAAMRLAASAQRFGSLPASAGEKLAELTKLESEIQLIANQAPKKAAMQDSIAGAIVNVRDFLDGKIDIKKATQVGEALEQNGVLAYGHQVVDRAGAKLNRAAVLRSEFAQLRGFNTHAAYQVARQGLAYTKTFRHPKTLRAFLYGLLKATDPVVKRWYDLRARQLGLGAATQLRPYQLSLLGFKTNLLVRDYFPREQHAITWRRTMLENGFAAATVDRVILDLYPRANKATNAYMRPIHMPTPNVLRINGATLDVTGPGESDWSPARIYVLENFASDGIQDLSTAFHEGGHALDFSARRDRGLSFESNGYAETHSITMESFLRDRAFLLANGKTRDGYQISPELVDLYLKRSNLSDLMRFRAELVGAIFDLELWDYDYAHGSTTFIDRALALGEALAKRSEFVAWPKDLAEAPGYDHFVTNHFFSGEVRYYGYVLASVAAQMMQESLREKLQAASGRIGLYQQPAMAQMLNDGIYRAGFEPLFPQSIEAFTGHKYSPATFAAGLVAKVNLFIDELAK